MTRKCDQVIAAGVSDRLQVELAAVAASTPQKYASVNLLLPQITGMNQNQRPSAATLSRRFCKALSGNERLNLSDPCTAVQS